MKSINLRKLHTELYTSTKSVVMESIAEARRDFSIPYVALYMDLIKSKTSNEKYLALRVSFNSKVNFNLSFNLAVRRFAPSLQERLDGRLSETLTEWATGVLQEFGVEVQRDVLTSTSDRGSDVKRCLGDLINAWWEWCLSHLSHLALTEAFGTTIDPAKSRNKEARDFIQRIKKVVESVNKSEYLLVAFESAMIEEFGMYLKLLNSPQHRWSAVALVLERILITWDVVMKAYRDARRPLPLTDADNVLCVEFYSIIEPVRAVQVKAQAMKTFVAVDVYVLLLSLYTTILDVNKPLQLQNPKRHQVGNVRDVPIVYREHEDLQPASRKARSKLVGAFMKRFFNRYHPLFALRNPKSVYGHNDDGEGVLLKDTLVDSDFKFSYLLDAQSMLFPGMASGKAMLKLIQATDINRDDIPLGWTRDTLRKQHYKFVLDFIWGKISYLAESIAERIVLKKKKEAVEVGTKQARQRSRPAKKARTIDVLSHMLELSDNEDGDGERAGDFQTAKEIVAAEIEVLHQVGCKKADWPDPANTPNWWAHKSQMEKMPCIGEAALAILACKPSAGGLECDLGGLSDVLAPKRSALRAGLVEVNMFLKINNHLVPTNPDDVAILGKDWKSFIPTRPAMNEREEAGLSDESINDLDQALFDYP